MLGTPRECRLSGSLQVLILKVPDLYGTGGRAGLAWALTLSLTLNQW